jgi:ArsR family transcriptional regulator, virulence genes transcriptional regulator
VTTAAEIEECRLVAAEWAPVLRALANEERLLITLWLADTECTVRELEEVTGMRQSLVSYHLQELRREGIVTAFPAGRSNRYHLSRPDLDQLALLIGTLVGTARSDQEA